MDFQIEKDVPLALKSGRKHWLHLIIFIECLDIYVCAYCIELISVIIFL